MPQIQTDQRKIHVLYLVKVINAKDSRFHDPVVMVLSTPGRDAIYYFFLLDYFCTIIYIF